MGSSYKDTAVYNNCSFREQYFIACKIGGNIPRQLQNKHFDGEEAETKGQNYKYPHDFKNHYVNQQYLPDALKNKRYYEYGENKTEQKYKAYWDSIKNN